MVMKSLNQSMMTQLWSSNIGCSYSDGGNQCLTAAKVSPDLEGNLSLSMNESVDNYISRDFPQMGGKPLTLYTGPKNRYLEKVLSQTTENGRR